MRCTNGQAANVRQGRDARATEDDKVTKSAGETVLAFLEVDPRSVNFDPTPLSYVLSAPRSTDCGSESIVTIWFASLPEMIALTPDS